MINRVLIRTKVVQVLYSYLLTDKQFSLEPRPTAPTKEKRFAYSLYLDMLVFMVKVAENVSIRGGERPLEQTRFIMRIKNDEVIKSLVARYRTEPFALGSLVDSMSEKIKESNIYKNYMKRRDSDLFGGQTVWRDFFNMIIFPDPEVNAIVSRRENFTMKGVERMSDIMNDSFVNFMASQDSGEGVFKTLETSLDKAQELFMRLLYLPVELTDLQERALEERRRRFITTHEDLNPNLKFVDNELVKALKDNDELLAYMEKNKISWLQEDPVMMDNLLKAITGSDIYEEYMSTSVSDLHSDVEFWRTVFRKIVMTNTHFLESLEDSSVFWNDDLEIMGTFVVKTFRKIEDNLEKGLPVSTGVVFDKYKDDEDARFGSELMKAVLRNKEAYRGYINDILDRSLWESERLAFMDVIVLETALAEIMNFPKIPLSVSINEYIEIAKSYSTAKSGGFVNGVLGALVKNLQEEGKLLKQN